jgi:hypothetical protein
MTKDLAQQENKPHFSFSELMAVKKGYNYWKWYKENKNRPRKPYQTFGAALHCYVLEEDKFTQKYEIVDKAPTEMMMAFIDSMIANKDIIIDETEREKIAYKNSGYKWSLSKVVSDFKLRDNQSFYETKLIGNKEFIGNEDYEKIRKMAQSIYNHDECCTLLKDKNNLFEHEIIIELSEYNCLAKVIIDCVNFEKNYLIDLKTTASDVFSFEESINKYSYDIQLLLYGIVCKELMQETIIYKYYNIGIEKEEPYAVGLFEYNMTKIYFQENKLINLISDWKSFQNGIKKDYKIKLL